MSSASITNAGSDTTLLRTQMRADDKKWNLMGLNLTLLFAAGVLPTPYIASSSWKLRLYRAYPVVMLALYFMVVIAQCLAMYKFWGDLDAITDNAFTMVGVFMCYFQAAYAVKNNQKILRLVETLETKLTSDTKTLVFREEQCVMITNTAHKTRMLTWTMFVIVHVMLITWIAMPIIQKYSQVDEVDFNPDKPSPYFCFIIWLPFDATSSPVYETVYTVQAICFLMACMYYTSINTVFMTFIIHTATQFKVLVMSLHDMDKLFPALNTKLEDTPHTGSEHRRPQPSLWSSIALNARLIQCINQHQAIIRYMSG